jgi:hypothetical protein
MIPGILAATQVFKAAMLAAKPAIVFLAEIETDKKTDSAVIPPLT